MYAVSVYLDIQNGGRLSDLYFTSSAPFVGAPTFEMLPRPLIVEALSMLNNAERRL